MLASVQLYASAALAPKKGPPSVGIEEEAGWILELVRACARREKLVAPAGKQTPYRPGCSVVTILTELFRNTRDTTYPIVTWSTKNLTWSGLGLKPASGGERPATWSQSLGLAWKHKSYMNSSFVVENTLRLRYQDQPVSVVARFGHWLLRESDEGKGKGNVYPRTGIGVLFLYPQR